MPECQDSVFKNVIKTIRDQLQNNKELIEQADVVFICGRSNTCLSSTAMLVGEMVRKFRLTQEDVKAIYKTEQPLTVVNSEMFTSDILTLAYNIGLPINTKILHIFDYEYVHRPPNLKPPFRSLDVVDLLKKYATVVVDDHKGGTHIQRVLTDIANTKLSGYVQVLRLAPSIRPDRNDFQSDEVKRIKNSFSLQGLKVVFIQTFKNKDTGIVTLDIFSARK